jgi:hypothetical protein
MQAMKTTEPIVYKEVENTTQVSERITFPKQCPTCNYIWNVEALSIDKYKGGEHVLGASEVTGFSINSEGCGTNSAVISLICDKIIEGMQTYKATVVFKNVAADNEQTCTTIMSKISSTSGAIAKITTLPATVPVNGNVTVSFIYAPSSSTATTANFQYKGLWQGADNSISSLAVTLPSCDFTENCCTESRWNSRLQYINGVREPMPECNSNLGEFKCDEKRKFTASFRCAQGCNAQNVYEIRGEDGNYISGVKVANKFDATITTPGTSGKYQLSMYSICGKDTCGKCSYPFTVICGEVKDCCKGSSWKTKSINWPGMRDLLVEGITANKPANPKNSAKKKIPITDVNLEEAPRLATSISIVCEKEYHLSQGGKHTFNAIYSCATEKCPSKVMVKIEGTIDHTMDGTYPAGVVKTFTLPGTYAINYVGYCGDKPCNTCAFTIVIDKNCCTGSSWRKAQYKIVNKKSDGSLDNSDSQLYDLSTVGLMNFIKADASITISNLDYECVDQEGCKATYLIKRKNLKTGLFEQDEILSGGINSVSVYVKPYPQLITITAYCGGKRCSGPIIIKLECLNKDCEPTCPPNKSLTITQNHPNGIYCEGETLEINSSVEGIISNPAYTYQWYGVVAGVTNLYHSYNNSYGGNTPTLTIPLLFQSSSNYDITLITTSLDGRCKDTAYMHVIVKGPNDCVPTNFQIDKCYKKEVKNYCSIPRTVDGSGCTTPCGGEATNFCGMSVTQIEIPCPTGGNSSVLNMAPGIKYHIFTETPLNNDEKSLNEMKSIVNKILPNFVIDDLLLTSYNNNNVLLVTGNLKGITACINMILSSKEGKLYVSENIKVIESKNSAIITKSINKVAAKKHDYVGHVTLLR